MFRNNSQECTAGISKSQIDKDPKKIYVLLWEGFQRSKWFCFPDSILFSIVHWGLVIFEPSVFFFWPQIRKTETSITFAILIDSLGFLMFAGSIHRIHYIPSSQRFAVLVISLSVSSPPILITTAFHWYLGCCWHVAVFTSYQDWEI